MLLKVFHDGAVLVKLSDFDLVKDQTSAFTRTRTKMRGTIRDPLLDAFKSYGVLNEVYAVCSVLSYIFTERETPSSGSDRVSQIIQKCAVLDLKLRYQTVLKLTTDVERLEATPTDAPT
ncbi:MAG: hypothetical protein ACTHW1_08265 [Ancrocorticia sp.]|uniref:hypothetical protein n=1 Tax=Ancrocorticia sp. TaxID=2593684 RepID=UPI003F93DBCB